MICDLPKCREAMVEIFIGLAVCQKHLDADDRGEISLRDICISEGLATPIVRDRRFVGAEVIPRGAP